jgi:membrane-associated PAP2 superfamily phosphatase
MNRTGLLIALAVAVLVGIVFGVYPKLDIIFELPFYRPDANGFWARLDPVMNTGRDVARLIVTLLVAPAAIAILVKLFMPRRPMLIPGRAAVFLAATLALGPGLVTNVILKTHWGRPRPVDVTELAGERHFVAWWDPRGTCPDNCSFVAGEPSGAFWAFAPAALAPPAWRTLAYAGALTFGAVVGLERMAAGGHFFSDVVFAGVFTFLIIWLNHGLLYRWRSTRISDRDIERGIERLTLPFHQAPPHIAPPAPTRPEPTGSAPTRDKAAGRGQ